MSEKDRARALIGVSEPFHGITYYSRELLDWTDAGYRGWWHAYFGYRSAPLGPASAGLVAATFFNFAPRMVERAVPGVWAINSPSETIALRSARVDQAVHRIFDSGSSADIARAAIMARRAIADCDAAGRPLFGAYAELEWPTEDRSALWHACTLLREHRFDGHSVALLNAGVNGVACHLLMAGHGRGNRATILSIRGWTEDEWDDAGAELQERGWLAGDGSLTSAGQAARRDIERHTDSLARQPITRLGSTEFDQFIDLMTPLVEHLRATGEVASSWPPAHLHQKDAS